MGNPPGIRVLDSEKQITLDRLLDENQNGHISEKDKQVLRGLVDEAERLMVENAKSLAAFSECEQKASTDVPTPVTVWIKPSSAAS
jgi:hypothetical protein